MLDLTNPTATAWFEKQASALMDNFGIDGFKFDAADPEYYDDDFVFSDGSERSTQAKIWAEIGAKYSFNELRAGFNAGWLPVVNRLRDKNHSWNDDGLNTLVPDGIAMGLCVPHAQVARKTCGIRHKNAVVYRSAEKMFFFKIIDC